MPVPLGLACSAIAQFYTSSGDFITSKPINCFETLSFYMMRRLDKNAPKPEIHDHCIVKTKDGSNELAVFLICRDRDGRNVRSFEYDLKRKQCVLRKDIELLDDFEDCDEEILYKEVEELKSVDMAYSLGLTLPEASIVIQSMEDVHSSERQVVDTSEVKKLRKRTCVI